MLRSIAVLLGCGFPAVCAVAAPFDVPIDSGQSVLNVELCVSGNCETDASPVEGTVTIALDSVAAPGQIWLHDFDLQFVDELHWVISWGFLGNLDATVSDGSMRYVTSNGVLGPEPITTDQYAFSSVPASPDGILDYVATGLACSVLMSSGQPCADTRDLGVEGLEATADSLGGALTSQASVVSLSIEGIDITMPVDPENPGLGTLHVTGSLFGQTSVALPGDFDEDGDVDLDDYAFLADCAAGPESAPFPALPGVDSADCLERFDSDDDEDIDLGDWSAFQSAFTGAGGLR